MEVHYDKYLTYYDNYINVRVAVRNDEGMEHKTRKVMLDQFSSFSEAVAFARKTRDEFYKEITGQRFQPEFTYLQTAADKRSKTGIIGVVPYVDVKIGLTKPIIVVGFMSNIMKDDKRKRQLFSFNRNDRSSMKRAFKQAAEMALYERGIQYTKAELEEKWDHFDFDFEEVISEKVSKAIQRHDEKNAQTTV